MLKPLEICILAAGKGTRMKSSQSKVLQTLAGKPLLGHILDTAEALQPQQIHVVVGPEGTQLQDAFADRDNINWVVQSDRFGTGHAVMQAAPFFSGDAPVLILLGDAPLIRAATLSEMVTTEADLLVLTVKMDDPTGYGRIQRNNKGQVTAIVEDKDADAATREIQEINSGVMLCAAGLIEPWLEQLDNKNQQQEYLLTDMIRIAAEQDFKVETLMANDKVEVTGVNDFVQLAKLERSFQQSQAEVFMAEGVHIMDPARFDVRGEVSFGRDVRVDINVLFEGEVVIGDAVQIGPNCIIKDSQIGNGTVIKANSVIDGAVVSQDCSVGPFARLRPGALMHNAAAVGNFVEMKKSTLGPGSKASHLSYLGDSLIGENVNIGAGTITCNYDGVNKWQTKIGDGVFVGSNTALVAPVNLADGVTIAAGSTITSDVSADHLAVARGRQRNIPDWQRPKTKSDIKSDKKPD
ncbi:MAG: bifunctional UDP-N-acetylglucosamine diphosphorylase/glucosamine-1-phosphate N-acetyltransferase GlmU [Gammaproteobacteria bacterium]|jgi:bifunctional UDP-N-acetylglucosamine pyrophosphorylase / glucosamine-1-phosphate N-acetyltransferase|nr:bifunctional UDP-N-acetylglucosamine diphosphorylase/glucosamine-1-phosphate N-acetyltransferase GlmU [Gammaproteobacteria bacterium]MBT5204149.1 bifunctional UDP-N-acetylglucosamine diphosphorylase/glucosamine-1-phosphate N-acetyltransferase GlmU [Gammaproteobacteria bacterium]MBT5601598.1 bifunctional UDP-N-acetylglucosamine diphosphorylase/glucosamine-1-phosphate N-acetyltransferase GlmU [Gammaproteobacteria bacterium]MBT6244236.1 bifunctional UDP-N-acetylglucosamine diphosphorylase/glucos